MPRVLIVATEPSGDLHGAKLVAEMRRLRPDCAFSGVGGAEMAAAGVERVARAEDLAVMGFLQVVPKLGAIWQALRRVKRNMAAERPDLVILIDSPDFNFRLFRRAKKLGLKVLYYISPQVWAWRRGRARTMGGYIDHLAVIFPFEPLWWRQMRPFLPVTYVGHPLMDELEERIARQPPIQLRNQDRIVALLPGSRRSELKAHLPLMLGAAGLLKQQRPDLQFLLPLAPGLGSDDLRPYLHRAPAGLTVVPGGATAVMAASRLVLVTSGTATLETALVGTPMVVVYKVGPLNRFLGRLLVDMAHFSMPNLIAGRQVVPELIRKQPTPELVAAEALPLLADGEQRSKMLADLQEVRQKVGGPGASRRAAELALGMMENKP